jgi:hypothetical protein
MLSNMVMHLNRAGTHRHIVWDGQVKVRAGDWVFQVSNGHVLSPAYVVRVARSSSDRMVWLSYMRNVKRPSIGKLREVLPILEEGFEQHELSGQPRLGRIPNLHVVR